LNAVSTPEESAGGGLRRCSKDYQKYRMPSIVGKKKYMLLSLEEK